MSQAQYYRAQEYKVVSKKTKKTADYISGFSTSLRIGAESRMNIQYYGDARFYKGGRLTWVVQEEWSLGTDFDYEYLEVKFLVGKPLLGYLIMVSPPRLNLRFDKGYNTPSSIEIVKEYRSSDLRVGVDIYYEGRIFYPFIKARYIL